MANSTPIFAVASRSKIQSYIDSQILTYPSYVFCKDLNTMVFIDKNLQIQDIKGFNQASINMVDELPTENIQSNTFYVCNGKGYLLINDILVPVFKELSDDSVSDYDLLENLPIVNKYGDISSPIVLIELENGSYSISGQYKVGGDVDTIYVSSKNVIVLVESDEEFKYITKLGRNVCQYKVNLSTLEVSEQSYATQEWVKEQGYTTKTYVDEAIEALYKRITEGTLVSITKVSQLENDMGYLTEDDLNEISDESIANLF